MKLNVLAVILGIGALILFLIVWHRQSELKREQEELKREMQRNPFVEPGK